MKRNPVVVDVRGQSREGRPAAGIGLGSGPAAVGGRVDGDGEDRGHAAAFRKAAARESKALDKLVHGGLGHTIANHTYKPVSNVRKVY